MGASKTKRRLLSGLPKAEAKKVFRDIWQKRNPDGEFAAMFPKKLFEWLDLWYHLRADNQTINAVVDAFAARLKEKNRQIRTLEETIVAQRKELAKRYSEIAQWKAPRTAVEAEVRQSRQVQTGVGEVTHPTESSSGDGLGEKEAEEKP